MSNATAQAIAHITEVVTRTTRILSNRSIQVVQAGMKVGVEYDDQGAPTKVFLPSLTDNPSPELITAIQGFLDKEVSTLLYTDFDVRHKNRGYQEFKKGMAKSLQDIIEDSRTERAMRKEFRGSAVNFDRNHDFAVKEIIQPTHATEKNNTKRMANLALPAIRAACGDIAYEEFMKGKWEQLGPLGGAILHYADELANVGSTQESFDLTRKIIQKMEEGDDDEDNDEGDGQSGASCDGDGDGSGEGGVGEGSEGDDDSEADGKGSGSAAGADSKGKPTSSSGADAGKDEEKDKDKKSALADQDKVDLSKVNKDTSLNKVQKARPTGSSGTSSGKQQFGDYDAAFEEMNFDTKMQEKIKKIAGTDAAAQGSYVPYSRQYDYVGPLPNLQQAIKQFASSPHGQQIMDHAVKNSHVIQQQIQKLFMAKSMTRWEPGHKRGKINPSALYRLPQGDPRVFRRKIESNSRDVAVSLVIDMSGSMGGPKIQNACIAALMFSQVLTSLNIAHEISSFTTYSGYGLGSTMPHASDVNHMIRNCNHAETVDGRTVYYSRIAPITNYILKGWSARLDEDTKRAIAMIPGGFPGLMSGNVDGESIELVGRRLLARKEKKKVMIVMSDGCPASDGHGGDLVQHLKTTVKRLSDSGIEMLGLGLQDRSVNKFYPKSEVVDSTEEIPTKILELTRKMVVGV